MLEKQLIDLGFSDKEAKAYLALLEYGTQPASVIARKTGFPKATVLFLFENLVRKGYVRRSQKGRVLYFYSDPRDLDQEKNKELSSQQQILQKLIPLLSEFKNPFTSPPKVLFFEGLDGCRKAYLGLLESETPIYEFCAHNDLERMGVDFMKDFIHERAKRKIMLYAITENTKMHASYQPKNKSQRRDMRMFPSNIGTFFSSISIFDNKVLLLNLHHDMFGISIESKEFSETLKTIHHLAWKGC